MKEMLCDADKGMGSSVLVYNSRGERDRRCRLASREVVLSWSLYGDMTTWSFHPQHRV